MNAMRHVHHSPTLQRTASSADLANMDNFLHRGTALQLHEVTGSVISSDVKTTSELSVSGGGGSVPREGGYIRPAKLHVANADVQELWLKLEDGTQKRYVMTNCTIPVLVGHRVQLVLGTTKGARKDILVGLWNLDAREYHALPGGKSLLWFVDSPEKTVSVWLIYLAALIAFVIGVLLMVVASDTYHDAGFLIDAGSVGFSFVFFLWNRVVFAARMDQAFESLRMHILEWIKTQRI